MKTVAYLANQFPSPVEPYVADEIEELRRRGIKVIPCSVRRPQAQLNARLRDLADETLCIEPLTLRLALHSFVYSVRSLPALLGILQRVLFAGAESPLRGLRVLAHTWLGVYYALLLRGKGVGHIHVHHGYFGAWVAMVAARVLGISYSLTLHGSDMLLHATCLDTKLRNCKFCVTISEFNRRQLLRRYPWLDPGKIIVLRLGVSVPESASLVLPTESKNVFTLLSAGRLHAVKNHAFLVKACFELKQYGLNFHCFIAGDGPERAAIERRIHQHNLGNEVQLLGHLSPAELNNYYDSSDLIVLTSRSEGIPLVLMEAMARGKVVLAPAITGIPELVQSGKSGFLYRPGSMQDFVRHVQAIAYLSHAMAPLRNAAQLHVSLHFNRDKNVAAFADAFLARVSAREEWCEDSVLQQV
jgi:glycosyltransferase involved in cell wall biosynthesis